jgi:hypothetical protein
MGDEHNISKTGVANVISIGKDTISFFRDAILFLLAVLLIAFPQKFNSMLVEAGFNEGNIGGFKWQASLVKSNQALEEAQSKISELQKISNEQMKILVEAKKNTNDQILIQRIAKVEKENISGQESTGLVQRTVAQTIKTNVPLVEKVQPAIGKSDYLVGLQTLGIPDTERASINSKLSSEGYGLDSLTWSYPAGERPSWFSDRSTVFYYSTSALPAAKELARFMKTITKQDFDVRRGGGLGVDPSRKDVTLFIHFIKG